MYQLTPPKTRPMLLFSKLLNFMIIKHQQEQLITLQKEIVSIKCRLINYHHFLHLVAQFHLREEKL